MCNISLAIVIGKQDSVFMRTAGWPGVILGPSWLQSHPPLTAKSNNKAIWVHRPISTPQQFGLQYSKGEPSERKHTQLHNQMLNPKAFHCSSGCSASLSLQHHLGVDSLHRNIARWLIYWLGHCSSSISPPGQKLLSLHRPTSLTACPFTDS